MSLNEIVTKVNELENILSVTTEELSPAVRANFEGRQRQAELDLAAATRQYMAEFRSSVELILLEGPSELVAKAVESFRELKIISVNASGFYDTVLKSIYEFSPQNTLTVDSFASLIGQVRSLAKLAQVVSHKTLEFEPGNPEVSFRDNVRALLRKQIGKSGIESTWVSFEASALALQRKISVTPTPVVVYNIAGATAEDYNDVFASVNLFTVEAGTKVEVKSFLKNVQTKLKQEGKLKTEKLEEGANTNE